MFLSKNHPKEQTNVKRIKGCKEIHEDENVVSGSVFMGTTRGEAVALCLGVFLLLLRDTMMTPINNDI